MANQHYKTTDWKGHKNYECLYSPCKFATLDLKEINLHVGRHISDGVQVDPAEWDKDPGDQAPVPEKKPTKGRGKKVK